MCENLFVLDSSMNIICFLFVSAFNYYYLMQHKYQVKFLVFGNFFKEGPLPVSEFETLPTGFTHNNALWDVV